MGKDLHPSIIRFFEQKLDLHNKVNTYKLLNDSEFYIYYITRKDGLRSLYVVLSDDYQLGEYAQITVHPILKYGGFILIARPEAKSFIENDINAKIGIGKIGKLLAALYKEEYWNS